MKDKEFIDDGHADALPTEQETPTSDSLNAEEPSGQDAEEIASGLAPFERPESEADAGGSFDPTEVASVDELADRGSDAAEENAPLDAAADDLGADDELNGTADLQAATTDESAMAAGDKSTDDVEVEVEFSDTLAFRGGDLDERPMVAQSPPLAPEGFVEPPARFPAVMQPSAQFEPIVFRVMSPEGTYAPQAAPENEADAENSVSEGPDATGQSDVDAGAYFPSLHEADSRSPRFEPRTVEVAVSVRVSVNKVEQIAQIAAKEAGILAERVVDDRFEVIREEQFRRDAQWRAVFW